ncbi:MAG: hypothetical protein J6R59_09805 [Paludibacteraceae bacterium]|nr:hypothetical protein [Paludibacteraceae bacterium]
MPILKVKNEDGTWSEVGGATDNGGGFAAGVDATTTAGAAIGRDAIADWGGAVGHQASTGWGGAIGHQATSQDGFSGGYNAKSSVDAIQLGAGTNTKARSLQVYDKQLMDGNGYIPASRLICYSTTIEGTLDATYKEHIIERTWTNGLPIVRSVNRLSSSGAVIAAEHVVVSIVDNDYSNELRLRVQRPTGVATSTEVSYKLQIDIIGI